MPQLVTSAAQLLAGSGPRVFVSDFDGTMTGVDFFDVVLNHVPPDAMPDFWGQCVAGEITHVEALSSIFQHATHDERELRSWLPETRLDPDTCKAYEILQQKGWDLVVVSAGCQWYIMELLSALPSQVKVVANPGEVAQDRGLWMGWPAADVPWYSAHFGIEKAALIRVLQQSGKQVAFAGDGRPDLTAAREVPAEFRFARTWLAEQLTAQNLGFLPFERWSDIANHLPS